jgi:glycosyltransferase involved in cell wall biosynthesis
MQPVRVMLVDDHRIFLETVAMRLRAHPDLQVVAAEFVPERVLAPELVRSVDVAVLDLMLRDLDGIQLGAELRRINRGRRPLHRSHGGLAREARPNIVVVQQRGAGKGAALRTGFEIASGDVIVMMDADGSMEPSEIVNFVTAVEQGYEFVKGSRCVPGGGSADLTPVWRLGNRALTAAVNMLFLVPFSDLCYGFVAFRRDSLERLALTAQGFEFETEIAIHAIKAGLRIAEVPSVESPRRYGTSNLRALRDGQRVLRTIARERMSQRRRPVVDCFLPEDLHFDLTPLPVQPL